MRIGAVLAIAVGALASAPATGQTRPPPVPAKAAADATPLSGLTVTAPARTPVRSLPSQASQFVDSHGAVARSGHLARWYDSDPVCSIADGLPPAFDAFVVERIRTVARSVGAPVASKEDCRPNIEVLFFAAPQQLLDELKRGPKSLLLGYHDIAATNRIATVKYPVQGWYLTSTRNKRGAEFLDVASSLSDAQAFGGMDPMQAGHSPGGCADSRLDPCIHSVFRNVIVVADANKVAGMPIGPVSDLIAMLALSQPKLRPSCDDLPSILDLITDCPGRAKPEALTSGDQSYLRGLYSTDLNLFANLERGNISTRMVRDLARPTPARAP